MNSLLLHTVMPWALLADVTRRLIEQPADWTFVSLQIALLAIQIFAGVWLWRCEFLPKSSHQEKP